MQSHDLAINVMYAVWCGGPSVGMCRVMLAGVLDVIAKYEARRQIQVLRYLVNWSGGSSRHSTR